MLGKLVAVVPGAAFDCRVAERLARQLEHQGLELPPCPRDRTIVLYVSVHHADPRDKALGGDAEPVPL
jgi:hypothetical protein